MKRKLIIIIIIILLVILALFIVWLPTFLMTGNRQTIEEAFAWQTDHYDTSFYEELKKTDYTMETSDGYVIHAELLENPEPTDDYVIISHGYTDNRMGALKYVPMYLKLGFNCIIYDLRGHGGLSCLSGRVTWRSYNDHLSEVQTGSGFRGRGLRFLRY